MSQRNASDVGDPCATRKTDYENALQREAQLKAKFEAAWRSFLAAKDLVSAADYADVKSDLVVGDWPESVLGPVDGPLQGYPSMEFFKYAKAVYLSRLKHKEAQEATTERREELDACKESDAYLNWLRSKAQTAPCGAPCTSPARKGQLCHHMLGIKRCCPNHGPRPVLV